MSLGLFNCRLIQPTGDQLFFLSAVLPHRCQFGQALFSLLVARPARPRPAGGRRMLLAFPSQKDFAWFSAGAKSRRRQKSSLPPIHPRISPKIHLTLPIDSAIEPEKGTRVVATQPVPGTSSRERKRTKPVLPVPCQWYPALAPVQC